MGDRYTLSVKCPGCGYEDDDVWYAPTCGYMAWQCPKCKKEVNLEEYSGIDAMGCANTSYGEKFVEEQRERLRKR
jgi:phage FluMu protein Com